MPETIDWPMHDQAAQSAPCRLSPSCRRCPHPYRRPHRRSPTGSTFCGSARSATRSVFWKTWGLEWGTFAAFAVLTFLILFGAFLALRHSHAADLPDTHTIFFAGRPIELPVAKALHIVAVIAALLIAIATGVAMEAQWPTLALYWYAPHAATTVSRPHLRPAARLLSLHPAGLAAYRRMAAHAGRHCLHSCRAVSLVAGGGRALGGRLERFRFPALARRLHCRRISAAHAGDPRVCRPLRAAV